MLATVGSVGDAYDNALAESFVDSFKTELIADRVWRSRTQLELAIVEYVGWFNNARLHESLGDLPPAEYEQRWCALTATTGADPDDQSLAPLPPRAAEALAARRLLAVDAETVGYGADHLPSPPSALGADALSSPENARLNAGPPALSLHSPSGLAPRNGGSRHNTERATTLTTENTETN